MGTDRWLRHADVLSSFHATWRLEVGLSADKTLAASAYCHLALHIVGTHGAPGECYPSYCESVSSMDSVARVPGLLCLPTFTHGTE